MAPPIGNKEEQKGNGPDKGLSLCNLLKYCWPGLCWRGIPFNLNKRGFIGTRSRLHDLGTPGSGQKRCKSRTVWNASLTFSSRPNVQGANVNAAKLHETALHHAAKVQNADLAEMLIQFGGNVYARDNRGKRPSDYSQRNSSTGKCFAYYERELLLSRQESESDSE
ncbi:Ankyrin repeat and SOCS box protein 13, partial [Ophiophagus hannah]